MAWEYVNNTFIKIVYYILAYMVISQFYKSKEYQKKLHQEVSSGWLSGGSQGFQLSSLSSVTAHVLMWPGSFYNQPPIPALERHVCRSQGAYITDNLKWVALGRGSSHCPKRALMCFPACPNPGPECSALEGWAHTGNECCVTRTEVLFFSDAIWPLLSNILLHLDLIRVT